MGRNGHLKLPDHLYLSPPQPSASTDTSSYLSLRNSTDTSAGLLLGETSSGALAVGDRIPGFKTSAAFLHSLRANLRLANDPIHFVSSPSASLTNTPDSLRPMMTSSTGSLLPPSPSPLSQPEFALDPAASDPLASIPPLTTQLASSTAEKVEALRLVADSVAQQRQLASKAIIFHPAVIASSLAVLAVIGQWLYKSSQHLPLIGTTYAGMAMAGLVTVRWASGGYVQLAEETGTWAWLDRGQVNGKEDDVLITEFGPEVIGALVLRGAKNVDSPNSGGGGSLKKRRRSSGGGKLKGYIRAWTVKQRYRGKGVGRALLEEAIRVSSERGWSGPVFAPDHANSGRILPTMFNGGFDRTEGRAREMLEDMVGGRHGHSTSSKSRGGKR